MREGSVRAAGPSQERRILLGSGRGGAAAGKERERGSGRPGLGGGAGPARVATPPAAPPRPSTPVGDPGLAQESPQGGPHGKRPGSNSSARAEARARVRRPLGAAPKRHPGRAGKAEEKPEDEEGSGGGRRRKAKAKAEEEGCDGGEEGGEEAGEEAGAEGVEGVAQGGGVVPKRGVFRGDLSGEEAVLLEHVLEMNGVAPEALESETRMGEVEVVEMFLSHLPSMRWVRVFANLTELALVHLGVEKLEGLSAMGRLRKLILSENRIGAIGDSLRGCLGLEELYLYDNEIERIEGLDGMGKLRTLWLAGNRIGEVGDALAGLGALRELNLARNQLACVEESLVKLHWVTHLNLADNRIASFQDVLQLKKMRGLRNLCLSDPHWGENPVVTLSNYQTYALYHLSQLEVLDTLALHEETKLAAESTFVKKKMFYNMKIKTWKRRTAETAVRAYRGLQAWLGANQLVMDDLKRRERVLAQEVELGEVRKAALEGAGAKNPGAIAEPGRASLVRSKLRAISQCVSQRQGEIAQVEAYFEACRRVFHKNSSMQCSRIMAELETGGNIRLEDGSAEDVWYSSCVDLLQSRFQQAHFDGIGVDGVRVTRVTRVHNRSSKLAFEQGVARAAKGLSPHQCKEGMDYLFYAVPLGEREKLQRILQLGFPSPQEYAEHGLDEAVPLVNSVALADRARLLHRLAQHEATIKAGVKVGTGSPLRARLVVAKVYTGNSCTAHDSAGLAVQGDLRRITKAVSGLGDDDNYHAFAVCPRHYPEGTTSVVQPSPRDSKQRHLYLFDCSLAVPEYIIEYEYTCDQGGALYERLVAAQHRGRTVLESEEILVQSFLTNYRPLGVGADMDPVAEPLVPFLALADALCPAPSGEDAKRLAESGAMWRPGSGSDVPEKAYVCAAVNRVLLMEPREPSTDQPPEFEVLDKECLARHQDWRYGGFPPHELDVVSLNLNGLGIRRIQTGGMEDYKFIKSLVLSFNEIGSMAGLEGLKSLEKLDLSHNFIENVEGLQGLRLLNELDLSNNLVHKIESVNSLKQSVPLLKRLWLKGNPVAQHRSYRSIAIRRLSSLKSLDSAPVSESERNEAMNNFHASSARSLNESASPGAGSLAGGVLTEEIILSNSQTRAHTAWSLDVVDDERWAEFSKPVQEKKPGTRPSLELSSVVELELDFHDVRRIHGLEKLVSLQRASFCDNEIFRIEGLEQCTNLQELQLEGNCISRLEGLEALVHLKRLDLGRNRLTCLDGGLSQLCSLRQLSLEDNAINSLAGMEHAVSLMELYLGNNRIESFGELRHLKGLPKLIILDLAGNPLCKTVGYRTYCIFNLRKIKILDSSPVEAAELVAAKEQFLGRVTWEFLADRSLDIGKKGDSASEMSLEGMRVRDVGSIWSDSCFRTLRELILDENQLVDVGGLAPLTGLRVLKLNRNRLTSLKSLFLPADSPAYANAQVDQRSGWCSTPGVFKSLEVLEICCNGVQRMDALSLSGLSSLRVLKVSENEIFGGVDGESVAGLYALEVLDLSRNKLRQLSQPGQSAFCDLVSLTDLDISFNGLKTLAGLDAINLRVLNAGNNRLAELSELERLATSENLNVLVLSSNPVVKKNNYRFAAVDVLEHLTKLDDVAVTFDERERAREYFFHLQMTAGTADAPPGVFLDTGSDGMLELGLHGSGLHGSAKCPPLYGGRAAQVGGPQAALVAAQRFKIAGHVGAKAGIAYESKAAPKVDPRPFDTVNRSPALPFGSYSTANGRMASTSSKRGELQGFKVMGTPPPPGQRSALDTREREMYLRQANSRVDVILERMRRGGDQPGVAGQPPQRR